MQVKLLNYTPDPERHIEYCARVCYNSQNKITEDSYAKFLPKLIKAKHYSILESSSTSLEISGVSRTFTHQLVRHRHGSYMQQSQRYVKLKEVEVVTPDSFLQYDDVYWAYKDLQKKAKEFYRLALSKDKIPAGDARFGLLEGTETTIIISGNFRMWYELLIKRLSPKAQWEFREVANEILNLLYGIAPVVFGGFKDEK